MPFSAAGAVPASSAAGTSTAAEARRWFGEARFGMFIHWGIYSQLGDGEWVMENRQIPAHIYERLARTFYPVDFNAAEWVSLARAAGMKYITFTSRHHDGFAMWGSRVSDWNVVGRTPFARDVVKELADECRRQGMKLFLYYSHLDWRHPDYFPRGRTGHFSGRPDSGTWERYMDYVDAQLEELLTGYGEIAGIWFDGWWDRPEADWRLQRTYALIHRLQPAALIGNNHHRRPFAGEDFQMFERDLPGHNTAGYSPDAEIGELPLETCDTMNANWGYSITDRAWKSTRELIHYLVRAAGYDANLLLNVGPMPSGQIPPESAERLREVGQWLDRYGESIYATRQGPIPPHPWGATTRKGNRIYVHVLDCSTSTLTLSPLAERVKGATALKDGRTLRVEKSGQGVMVELPEEAPEEPDRIVVLEVE